MTGKFYKVFGKPACGLCTQAMNLLTARNLSFEYVNLMEDAASLAMIRATGVSTVPQIYEHDGEVVTYIGGFTELRNYLNKNA